MRFVSLVLVLIATVMLPAPATYATPLTFVANLTGGAEIPPNGSPGTGHTTVVLDPAAHSMHVGVTFSGWLGLTTASHIHCCVPSPPLPGNFIVATTTPTFPGFPLMVQAGTYSHDFDLTLASSYNPAFVTAEGGVPQAELAFEAAIEAGTAYLNIHTSMVPSGEIRGILVATPAPPSLVLLGSALVGFILMRRRKPTAPS